ncbi:M48 family metallopeptidase [Immundisolibacter sp.]
MTEPVAMYFELDGQPLACRVLRARRRTYALRVAPDGMLELRMPQRLPVRLIPDILNRHRRWIAGQFELRARHVAQVPDFGHGSTQRYLGASYPLQLATGRTRVQLHGDRLALSVPAPEHAPSVTRALDAWYRAQAQALLPGRLTTLAATLPWLAGRVLPAPRVVRLRSRWGSCAADGRITLNLGLVLLAPPLIDYVLLHELCHLREMNHGPRFYTLLAAALPDHRERQTALRQERPWRPLPA